jgi:hypothetical protein
MFWASSSSTRLNFRRCFLVCLLCTLTLKQAVGIVRRAISVCVALHVPLVFVQVRKCMVMVTGRIAKGNKRRHRVGATITTRSGAEASMPILSPWPKRDANAHVLRRGGAIVPPAAHTNKAISAVATRGCSNSEQSRYWVDVTSFFEFKLPEILPSCLSFISNPDSKRSGVVSLPANLKFLKCLQYRTLQTTPAILTRRPFTTSCSTMGNQRQRTCMYRALMVRRVSCASKAHMVKGSFTSSGALLHSTSAPVTLR